MDKNGYFVFDVIKNVYIYVFDATGGFGSYLFGLSERISKQSAGDVNDFKNPSLGWIIGFLFIVSFLGLFSVVPLRKVIFIKFLKRLYIIKARTTCRALIFQLS